jgi:hypothetical protein
MMASYGPTQHPLLLFFGALTEKSFTEHLGWPDFDVTAYLSDLLVRFTHTDELYRINNKEEQPLDAVVDLLFESEVMFNAESLDREQDVHRHIGDFTLFMAGLFPERLRRLKSTARGNKDLLVDYVKTGKRSYGIVAEIGREVSAARPPLFRTLSENFERCVTGLSFVRSDLDRLQARGSAQPRRLLN